MIYVYLGDYQLVKHSIAQLAKKYNMKIQYSENIFDSLSVDGCFFCTPKLIYTIYDSKLYKDYTSLKYNSMNSKNIYCIIIEDIDKKCSFYKQCKKDIIEVNKPSKQVNLVDELYKNLEILNTIEEKDRLSFLYKVYYDRKHRHYAKQAGFCINEVLTGKIPVKNIFQIFLLTIR